MISDSVAIICLAKIGKLDLLRKLFRTLIIPNSVKEEVLVKGKPGYNVIFNAIEEGWINTAEPAKKADFGLVGAENDAIELARERNDYLILDDAFAIKVAKSFDIPTIRTTTVIFLAANKQFLTQPQATDALINLIDAGYYITPQELAALLARLKNN